MFFIFDCFHRYFLRSEYHEVLFPNSFKTILPEGDTPSKLDMLGDVKIPIFDLVHVTHNADHRSICKNPVMYEFMAGQKFGKAPYFEDGDYRKPRCGSYKSINNEAQFERIGIDETVFPGFYSWWGIHSKSECTRKIAAEIEDMKEDGLIAYVPNYLKEEPESYYGNRGFVCSFQNVLASYARSRQTEVANLFLRKGGTLRYTQEICYVIIVSTGDDRRALREFNPLPTSRLFPTNGLINRNGQIKDPTAIPTFCPKHIFNWFADTSEGYDPNPSKSYETTAFAFYFPNERGSMKVRKRNCSKACFFHDDKFCSKKQRPREGGPSVCPNSLY